MVSATMWLIPIFAALHGLQAFVVLHLCLIIVRSLDIALRAEMLSLWSHGL
jgi:hypothetical protein